MVQINFGMKEISAKIVYYGPGMSGKTTNLEKVHEMAPDDRTGNMTAIATEGDRTLFFDFMPLELGTVAGMKTKLQLYTVPGQIYYDATRKLVLQGADGVIFVADSHPDKVKENIESLDNLVSNLTEYGIDINVIPLVIQYNKRDLPNALAIEEMDKTLKRYTQGNAAYTTASAFNGEGVMKTLKELSKLVLADLNKKYGANANPSSTPATPAPPTTTAAPTPTAPTIPTPAPTIPAAAKPAAQQAIPVAVASSQPKPAPAKVAPAPAVVESHITIAPKKKGFFARLFGK